MKQFISILFLLFAFISAIASRIEYGSEVVISKPVYEDIYIAGGTVTVNAPVYGDLVVAGGNIYINDSISNDLILAGGTVLINGIVGDDIRCAGGQLQVLKNVGGDLVITGGQVEIAKGVTVNGELISSGGTVIVNGNLLNNARVFSGGFKLNGSVAKDLDSRGKEIEINGTIGGTSILSAQKIRIGNNAVFGNKVRYWAQNDKVDFRQSLKSGSAIYDPSLRIQGEQWYFLGRSTVLGLFWYVGMVFLLIALIQYFFSNTFKKAGNTAFESAARSLGYGFLFIIGVPVLVVLLIISLIGLPVGLFILFSYIALILLATIITSVVAANWLNNRFQYNWRYWKIVFSALMLFILFKLLTFTPFFGWLIMIALACIAFGSIIMNVDWRGKSKRLAV